MDLEKSIKKFYKSFKKLSLINILFIFVLIIVFVFIILKNCNNKNKKIENFENNELKKMDSFNELHKTKYSKDVASINSGEIYSNYNDSYKKNLKILNNNNQVQSINSNSLFDNNTDNTINKNNNLLSKLDYIIHLLEQQHNEKTNYITEDLILYLFLGIFIIYVLDIFSKSGKYNR